MSLILVPASPTLPSHLLLIQVLQLIRECHGATQHSSNCDTFQKLEKLFSQNGTQEMSTEPVITQEDAGGTNRSTRIHELDRLLNDARKKVAGLKNALEHQRHKLRELDRSVDKYRKEKLELEGRLEEERECVTKLKGELQNEKNQCLEISRDLDSQKEYDLELAAEIRKEKHRNAELARDLDAEQQYNAELDVNCRDKKGNTALHRWAAVCRRRGAERQSIRLGYLGTLRSVGWNARLF
jgi:chromosome segregation ATPase